MRRSKFAEIRGLARKSCFVLFPAPIPTLLLRNRRPATVYAIVCLAGNVDIAAAEHMAREPKPPLRGRGIVTFSTGKT